MKNKFHRFYYLALLLFPLVIFFLPFFFQNKVPIPADTIVGLYHPFRDKIWQNFSAGVPFKNFLITDAVRQQYPWRHLAISLLKQGEYPGWNPYTQLGTPLAANHQTALYYPLNFLFFFLPFTTAWSLQVVLQPFLLAVFFFFYLTQIKISGRAAALAGLALALGGFSVAWLEWNTTLNTLVWLPLALFSLEKIFKQAKAGWYMLLGFSLLSIIFSGFLQTAFYSLLIVFLYCIFKLKKSKKSALKNRLKKLLAVLVFVALLSAVHFLPFFRLLSNSARNYDQAEVLTRQDWFIPWQHLLQLAVPDFFGNPSTLNYWGVFNYTEFVSYLGMIPLFFLVFSLTLGFKKSKPVKKFFLLVFLSALVFSTPNLLAKIPFVFNLPFISSAQPSRLIMLIDFSAAVLIAFGIDEFLLLLSKKNLSSLVKKAIFPLSILLSLLSGLWIISAGRLQVFSFSFDNLAVSRRNLLFPSLLFLILFITLVVTLVLHKQGKRDKPHLLQFIFFLVLFLTTAFDLIRFARKFTPFTNPQFLYPSTAIIEYLQNDQSVWRYMTVDRRLLPPNFSIEYRLQTIEGYDPVYLKSYGTLMASAQENRPVLTPTAFNRIIRPENYQADIYDVLNVKYILSLSDLNDPKLEKILTEGETRLYQNKKVFPRSFILENYLEPESEESALNQILKLDKSQIKEEANIVSYTENQVLIEVETETGGMLVLTDIFYPGWEVSINRQKGEIKKVLYNLRGTIVPSGKHEVLYRYSQL